MSHADPQRRGQPLGCVGQLCCERNFHPSSPLERLPPAVEHDGVLGVRQSLIDLEPLSESCGPEEQQQQQHAALQPPGMRHQAYEPSYLAGGDGSTVGQTLQDGARAAPPAPPAAYDPLGAVLHPLPPEGEQRHEAEQLRSSAVGTGGGGDQLISFDGANGSLLAAPAPADSSAAVRSQLDDLLL